MKEFNAEAVRIETASALETVRPAQAGGRYPAYIGLNVHKQSIAVAVARLGSSAMFRIYSFLYHAHLTV